MYVKHESPHELALRTRLVSARQDLFETTDETAGLPEKWTTFSMWFEVARGTSASFVQPQMKAATTFHQPITFPNRQSVMGPGDGQMFL